MSRRSWSCLVLLAALLLAGCETIQPTEESSEDTPAKEVELPRGPVPGGNVRSNPYYPPLSSEVERADYRFW
jgi:PBP1b-binding outer membrane lipoprotein LpoB